MQGDVDRKRYGSIPETARALYAEGGTGAFFRGYMPRATMIAAAFVILNEANAILAPVLFSGKLKQGEEHPADSNRKR